MSVLVLLSLAVYLILTGDIDVITRICALVTLGTPLKHPLRWFVKQLSDPWFPPEE